MILNQNEQFNSGITKKSYWDKVHALKEQYRRPQFDSYKNMCDKLIFDKIKEHYKGGSILEVGAGGSDWLIDISSELKPSYCAGLDYSQIGVNSLQKKSDASDIAVDAIHADMFRPPDYLLGQFDFVISFGVVEHFKNLVEVLNAISKFSKPKGILFTLIPNMAGINGWLTSKWNNEIYNLHIPHDLKSLMRGHKDVGLQVVWGDYLGSTNFGVISSCFQKHSGMKYWLYKQLTRISKIVWLIESKSKLLPVTRMFSPYIVVVSRVQG